KKLDNIVTKHKFPNRSQAIRFLISNTFVEDALKKDDIVAGCLVLIFDHHKRDLVNKSLDIQHQFSNLILSTQHVHLDHHNCLEMIALKGKASKLKQLADLIISLKGIQHGKLTITKA
ncbi:nickel responsive regulator, partial [bacterium B13(2017)]